MGSADSQSARRPSAIPEVLPPARSWREKVSAGAFNDEHLDILSHLLDDFIHIPGTPIRFGLDGIVGFFPGIGDLLGGIASTLIIIAAWVRGVAFIVLARMVLNVAIETAIGAIPLFGNLFDIAWRANRRNYKLMEGSIADPRRHTASSWLVFAALAVVLAAITIAPALVVVWMYEQLKQSH